jgi:hypothetical protein
MRRSFSYVLLSYSDSAIQAELLEIPAKMFPIFWSPFAEIVATLAI